ncbi:Radical SAM domain protein [Spirochaeta thermophila DSM 6578]|uniref:Radical SAM domain protein n=1 Tax=Winmispira thermophila (strain ATCC 700085 / DSM 6578 / Z-1203) TaxID=869211 RepID=G0GF68_WINT7|nr:[FeFe] hydrogenase H-cluster radical SAM maturase HydE [Spirochaeta thermophila]AEJ60767.1 Radical SAM domain protein [Spirochaeta thermophila DSM 6578]
MRKVEAPAVAEARLFAPEDEAHCRRTIEEWWRMPLEDLVSRADRVCRTVYGDGVYLRGLLEFSNYCRMDCLYCGIRRSNRNVHRYRLDEEVILQVVRTAFARGFRTFVLQSGEDPAWPAGRLARLVERIKEQTRGEAAVTLSCGLMTREEYRLLREAGADRYLMRFETADPDLHLRLRGVALERRIEGLVYLRELGYEVGSGFMVGLPGETDETMVENLLLCRRLDLDMVGIGPFIPHPETPLADAPQIPLDRTIRAVAILRLLLPGANLPGTTAAGSLEPDGRERMLASGGNVLMPNITPVQHKKDYLLYPGKICLDEDGFHCVGCLTMRVATVGKRIDWEKGTSRQYLWRQHGAEETVHRA